MTDIIDGDDKEIELVIGGKKMGKSYCDFWFPNDPDFREYHENIFHFWRV